MGSFRDTLIERLPPTLQEGVQRRLGNSDSAPKLKCFHLKRDVDESGVSGTGVVAVGVVLPSGKCIIEWTTTRAGVPGLGIYDDMEGLKKIHGHKGATKVVFDDE